MQCTIRYFLIVVIIFSIGCDSSDKQINLFINPSLAFDLNKISVRVKMGEDIILDTLIENRHIDESLFIKKSVISLLKMGYCMLKLMGTRKI